MPLVKSFASGRKVGKRNLRKPALCFNFPIRMLKSLPLIALMLGTVTAVSAEPAADKVHATPPVEKAATPVVPETALEREIREVLEGDHVRVALLINNVGGRVLDDESRIKGMERLGQAQDPGDVIIIADAMVPGPVSELYTSIKVLPDSAQKVVIVYTRPKDEAKPELIGYILRNMDDVPTKLVKYDGKSPWLSWITGSLRRDDAEYKAKTAPAKPAN